MSVSSTYGFHYRIKSIPNSVDKALKLNAVFRLPCESSLGACSQRKK